MVSIEQVDKFGQDVNELIVDKSDGKHPNRILRFTEHKVTVKGSIFHNYSVSVDWSKRQYAATMFLEKEDLEELINKLQIIVSEM